MFEPMRGGAVAAFIAIGTLALSYGNASALTVPARQANFASDWFSQAKGLYQIVKHRYHRHHRYKTSRRITLGINPARCHSPEWNYIYRYKGLWHQPRHYYTAEGDHFYHDPFWDFEPWWCDDRQVIKPKFDYKRHRRHHHFWSSGLSPKWHFAWCEARYASYDLRFNTFIGNNGKRYQCDSPYDFR